MRKTKERGKSLVLIFCLFRLVNFIGIRDCEGPYSLEFMKDKNQSIGHLKSIGHLSQTEMNIKVLRD